MPQSKIILLEDGEEYVVAKELEYNNEKYVLLANTINPKQTCIRKLKKEDEFDYVCRLDKDEFKVILDLFIKESNIA